MSYVPPEEQETKITIAGMYSQLGVNTAIGIGTLIIFGFLRPRNGIVYAPKQKYSSEKKQPPKIEKQGIFSWVNPVLSLPEESLIDKIGLDAVMFLRFIRMCRNMFLWLFLLGLAIIGVNLYGTRQGRKQFPKTDNPIQYLSISYLRDARWFWAHVAFTWIFSLIIFRFLYKQYKEYSIMKKQYFRSEEYQSSLHSRTLLITGVPSNMQSDEGLQRYIVENLKVNRQQISQVNVSRKVGRLPELIDEHEKNVRELESVLAKYLKNPNNISSKRPKHSIGGRCGGEKVDSIEYYTSKIQALEEEIQSERERMKERKAINYGFVSFTNIVDAHSVAKKYEGKVSLQEPQIMLAPWPKDIVWDNLTMTNAVKGTKRLIGNAFFLLLCFFWLFPIGLLSTAAQIQNIVKLAPFTENIFYADDFIAGFIESWISPLIMASLVLEAVYLKAMSLQKLGRATEAAQECRSVLDAVEKIFPQGIPGLLVDNKLQETVSKAVELLPELWKQAGCYPEAIAAYRRALLSQWNLDNECCVRIQKGFAVFLLYGGVEAAPPSLAVQIDGSFVPRNNIEEAILLLMILLRKFHLGKTAWDPAIMEHFTFALSLCGQTSLLAKQLEEILPGMFPRCDRWNSLALCYSGAGQNKTALNLLRKSLNKHEKPDDPLALLLAAKICSEDCLLASDGVAYARRAITNAQEADGQLKGVALRLLGVCLRKQAKVASSDLERSLLQSEALKSLDEAISFERDNPDLIFELGIAYAENSNANAALRCAKEFIDSTGGSILKGWRLLALVLSAQKRYSEAEVVTDAALDETAKWEQGPLLRMKAKLKIAQSLPMDAVETYRFLLALVQAQRKTFGSFRSINQGEDDKVGEYEVWQGLASLYSSLSHWNDAEVCLGKARALKKYSAATFHTEGVMCEARGQFQKALVAYSNALSLDLDHVPCKVSLGALLWKLGSKSLPAARSFLSDALRLEPTNRLAWYYLGMVHRDDGRMVDASDCFQAASMLEESDPIESFSSVR